MCSGIEMWRCWVNLNINERIRCLLNFTKSQSKLMQDRDDVEDKEGFRV